MGHLPFSIIALLIVLGVVLSANQLAAIVLIGFGIISLVMVRASNKPFY